MQIQEENMIECGILVQEEKRTKPQNNKKQKRQPQEARF